jgi:hypothetical protein
MAITPYVSRGKFPYSTKTNPDLAQYSSLAISSVTRGNHIVSFVFNLSWYWHVTREHLTVFSHSSESLAPHTVPELTVS